MDKVTKKDYVSAISRLVLFGESALTRSGNDRASRFELCRLGYMGQSYELL